MATIITYIPFVLIPVGLLFILMNWLCLLESLRKKRFVSVVPLVGPLLLGAGLLLYEKTKPFAALALIVDYGTLVFFCSVPILVRECWRTSRFNALHTLMARTDTAVYTVNLFKKGIFIMKIEYDPPQAADEHGAKLIQCGLRGRWRPDEGQLILSEYNKDRKTILKQTNEAEYIAHESGFAKDSEFSDYSLTDIKFQLK